MKSLLKQKSKIGIVQKSRKKYDVADVFEKRRRIEDKIDQKAPRTSSLER